MRIDRQFVRCIFRTSVAAGFGAVLLCAPAQSQSQFPPEKFENLQVLPKDIGQRELIDVMKRFSQGLGVRCWHCHEGKEGQDLSTFDFITDEKSHKQVAREMLIMMQEINNNLLKKAGQILQEADHGHDEAPMISCLTCHRGKTEPAK